MKKIIVFLLSLLLLIPIFAACKEKTDESTDSQTSKATIEVKNLDGRVINILCWDFGVGSKSILGYTGEVLYNEDENTATAVDAAKKNVINKVQEEYNCKIQGLLYGEDHQKFQDMIRNMVASGSNDYDMVFNAYGYLAPLVTEGNFMDLNSISTINFSNTWWDQNAREDLSIGNKLYFMCGDINTYDNDGTWCVLFNKTLKDKLGINTDFYQLVKDDQWTLDKFIEISKSGITTDSNGDGTINEFDTWAVGTETYNIYVHVVGGGEKIVKKDENDLPYFTFDTENTANALTKILDFYNEKTVVMVANVEPYASKYASTNCWEETVHKAFVEGRELFYICGLINVASFRKMNDDFGILPIPKTFEGQDSYYHTVSIHNMTALAVPKTVTDPEDLGLVIEALGKYSQEFVTPEYYDRQLKYRDTRDDESGEMLDIIFASRSYDLGAAFNWGGVLTEYMKMDKNFTSRFESIKEAAKTQLDTAIEQITSDE